MDQMSSGPAKKLSAVVTARPGGDFLVFGLLHLPTTLRAMSFASLGLAQSVLEGIKAMGYVEPTPIQLRAIPLIMEGHDVIGSAHSGPLPVVRRTPLRERPTSDRED